MNRIGTEFFYSPLMPLVIEEAVRERHRRPRVSGLRSGVTFHWHGHTGGHNSTEVMGLLFKMLNSKLLGAPGQRYSVRSWLHGSCVPKIDQT